MSSEECREDTGEGGADGGRSLRRSKGRGFSAAVAYLYFYFPNELWEFSTASLYKEMVSTPSHTHNQKEREREKTKIFESNRELNTLSSETVLAPVSKAPESSRELYSVIFRSNHHI